MKNGSGRSFECADSATVVQISWRERVTTRSLVAGGRTTGIGTSRAASVPGAGAAPSSVAETGSDGISSAPAAPDKVIKQIQAGRNRCRIVSPNWREHARTAHRNAPDVDSKRRNPLAWAASCGRNGTFFWCASGNTKNESAPGLPQFPVASLKQSSGSASPQDHGAPAPMGYPDRGWYMALRPLSIESAEALAGGGLIMRKQALVVAALG